MSEQPGSQPEGSQPGEQQSPELGLVPKNVDEIPKVFDLVIEMDCTHSMNPYIYAAKKKSKEVIDKFKTKYPDMTFRVAFVGYRDFDDREQFNICNFTTDIDRILAFIDGVYAYGGGDLAENLAGAFQKTIELSWAGDIKQIVLITDATPHGLEFHTTTYSDYYPDGDPSGLDPKTQIQLLASQRIGLYVLRIVDNPSIDIMLTVFSEAYKRGRVPGSKANFIIGDVADQMKGPSPHYPAHAPSYHSEFDHSEDAIRSAPSYEFYGNDRSLGDDDDDEDRCGDSVTRTVFSNATRGGNDDEYGAAAAAEPVKSVDDVYSDSLFEAMSSQF